MYLSFEGEEVLAVGFVVDEIFFDDGGTRDGVLAVFGADFVDSFFEPFAFGFGVVEHACLYGFAAREGENGDGHCAHGFRGDVLVE